MLSVAPASGRGQPCTQFQRNRRPLAPVWIMIKFLHDRGDMTPRTTIEMLIAEHGGWRVLRATLAALVRRRPKPPPDASGLGAHLRRDIGLNPVEPSRRHWDIRY